MVLALLVKLQRNLGVETDSKVVVHDTLLFIVVAGINIYIDVLIYSAAQLQECLVNLLSYLLTYSTFNNNRESINL